MHTINKNDQDSPLKILIGDNKNDLGFCSGIYQVEINNQFAIPKNLLAKDLDIIDIEKAFNELTATLIKPLGPNINKLALRPAIFLYEDGEVIAKNV